MHISSGAQLVEVGNGQISIADMDFTNYCSFVPGNGTVLFTGTMANSIKGTAITSFYSLEIAKTAAIKLSLENDALVSNAIVFTSGLLELNNKEIDLGTTGFLQNENENSRVVGASGGYVFRSLSMNAPNAVNAGNPGAIITSSVNLGNVIFKREHKAQSGSGITGSILRYYDIGPTNNTALNATLRFNYFDAEMNGLGEAVIDLFKSSNNGASWTVQTANTRNGITNYLEKTGIADFSLWTLSPAGGPLPVTGLEFYAKRLNNTTVQLDWKTIQEINNNGFNIERRKESETNFVEIGFVNSSAPGGNSTFPLSDIKTDANNFTGKTYYRLKQEDIDGRFTYSTIRVAAGNGNKQTVMQVWPMPSTGPVNVLVNGLVKPDVLMVYDVAGILVKQQNMHNNAQVQLSILTPGTYILRLAENKDLIQKVVVQ
ncbi:MAG: T9SS type A sorting domain-containing protein [Ferruginibacter sp.]